MPLLPMTDCTTPVEDLKLLYSKDYMALVSSGMKGLGASPVSWPPGPRPEPYKWTDSKGTTWTLVLLDGKWMYRDGKQKTFISASNLYDIMGVKKDPATGGPAPGESVPGTPTKYAPAGSLGPTGPQGPGGFNLSAWGLGGLSAGWAVVLGVGGYAIYKAIKKKRAT